FPFTSLLRSPVFRNKHHNTFDFDRLILNPRWGRSSTLTPNNYPNQIIYLLFRVFLRQSTDLSPFLILHLIQRPLAKHVYFHGRHVQSLPHGTSQPLLLSVLIGRIEWYPLHAQYFDNFAHAFFLGVLKNYKVASFVD